MAQVPTVLDQMKQDPPQRAWLTPMLLLGHLIEAGRLTHDMFRDLLRRIESGEQPL